MSAEPTVVEKEPKVEKKPAEPFLSKRRKNIVMIHCRMTILLRFKYWVFAPLWRLP